MSPGGALLGSKSLFHTAFGVHALLQMPYCQNKWRADACPEEQKLQTSIAKNQELQDLRLDATHVVPYGLMWPCVALCGLVVS